jgi:hypothetical protein
LPERSYADRIGQIWGVLLGEECQSRLRGKSLNLHPAGEDAVGNFVIKTEGPPFVKPDDPPRGIVFHDESFLVVYEKWSKETDTIVGYKFHYQRPGGSNFRYDMEETERRSHPKYHLQATELGEDVRLPTGAVYCEDVLQAIVEQFVDPAPGY